MVVLHCIINQRCPRPANAHEYRSRSLSCGEEVRLYDRITLWRWLRLEFDPTVTDLAVNCKMFEGSGFRVPITFSYLKHGKPWMVIRENGPLDATESLHEHCALLSIMLEVLDDKWSSSRHVEMWNLMKMTSYIHKWSNRITEKRLAVVARDVVGCGKISIQNLCSGDLESNAETLALAFELVRRGRLCIPDLYNFKITQNSLVTVNEPVLIGGADNG